MKKIIFIITALCIVNLTFASFPVSQTTLETNIQTEQVNNVITPVSTASGNGSGWGIASIACGFVGLFAGGLILGPLAIIFGALGLKKKLKGLAIAGLILGVIELLIIGLLIGILLAAV